MLKIGATFNEVSEETDRATGRLTRRLTRSGMINNTPTYHLNTAFTADSKFLALTSEREDCTALLRADAATGDLTVLAASPLGSPIKFTSGSASVIQPTDSIVVQTGLSIRLYDIHTGRESVLLEIDPQYRFGHPVGNHDGSKVYVPRSPQHPDLLRGEVHTQRSYFEACLAEFGGIPTTHLEIDVATRVVREIYHDPINGCSHIQPCPADPRIWLIDRDAPPLFAWGGDYAKTSRAWLLNIESGALTEIRPRAEGRFQIHTNWSADGAHIFYHGKALSDGRDAGAPGGAHYIGVSDHSGKVVWDQHFPEFYYGHVSSHPQHNSIIIDSLTTPDLVLEIDYTRPGRASYEVLARHDSLIGKLPGQASHPHCHVSPDGRWLSFNRADESHADVYLVNLIS